jgi:hypothetical protein
MNSVAISHKKAAHRREIGCLLTAAMIENGPPNGFDISLPVRSNISDYL